MKSASALAGLALVACSSQPTQTVGAGQGGYQFTLEFSVSEPSDAGTPGLVGSVSPLCLPSAPVEEPDGGADCLVEATVQGDAPCSTYPGMSDPPGPTGVPMPMLVDASSGTSRICAVNQLAGAQAQACKTDPSCTGCGPGWCIGDLNAGCPTEFLFAGGVLVLPGSPSVELVCDLETD